MNKFYKYIRRYSQSSYAYVILAIISFTEASFFFLPPDILLIPLVLGAPFLWKKIALISTFFSVLGGVFGYMIGAFTWNSIGKWIIEDLLGISMQFVNDHLDIPLPSYMIAFGEKYLGGSYLFAIYDEWNVWAVLIFGITPLPYKLLTITAGFARIDFFTFVIASIFARGFRFFFIAWIIQYGGSRAKNFIEKYANQILFLFLFLLVIGFVITYYFFER